VRVGLVVRGVGGGMASVSDSGLTKGVGGLVGGEERNEEGTMVVVVE